jgi:DnaJ like chaperone protein
MIGKFLGALLGLVVLRHPIGLVFGALLGHLFDIGLFAFNSPVRPRSFLEPLFAFAGALAKSDGRVSEEEIVAAEALMTRMKLNADQRALAIERFNAGKQAGFQVTASIVELRAWCGGRRDLAFLLLDMLLEVAYAEGPPAAEKRDLLRKLCGTIGVSERELQALSAMKGYGGRWTGGPPPGAGSGPGPRPPPGPRRASGDAYAILGVPHEASDREIKRAYRKLISQHHPDKLGDVPDDLKHRAEERAREINAAYERIKSQRGFK